LLNAALGRRVPPSQETSEGGRGVAGEGSMSSLRKTWGAAQIVKAAKKGKELKSAATCQRNSWRRQRRPGAAPTSRQDFYGLDAARRCEIRRRRRGAVRREIQELAQAATHNDATQHSVLAWGGSCGQLDAALMRLRLETNGSRPGRCKAPTSADPSG
jgi:hypothetical protein